MHEKMCTKQLARKRCSSQLSIKLFAKNIKKYWFFFQMTRGTPNFVILLKENENLQKWSNMQKSRMFIKNWLYQEQRPVEDN